MIRDYKKATTGLDVKNSAMIFKTAAPLDDRTAVRCKAALLSATAFGDTSNGTGWLFNGLITCDRETGDIYTLYNKDALILKTDAELNDMSESDIDKTIKLAWKKMATQDTVNQNMQNLAGVFQFKGVAYAIDADHTTITLKSGIKTVSGEDPVSGYVCNGFYYDVAHDKYYEWTKDSDTIYVKGTEVYTKSGSESSTLVYYVDYADTRYYAHDVSNNKITSFQSLDGGIIYPAGDGVDSETATTFYADSSKTVSIGFLTPHSYPAYAFTLIPDVTFSGSTITPGEGASGNNGHVYQIGEKEYASNGLIWVELGSPQQEINWVVL